MIRRRYSGFFALFLLAGTSGAAGQSIRDIEEEYRQRIRFANADSADAIDHALAAEASRFMREFKDAAFYLEQAELLAREPAEHNAVLRERLNHLLAVGSSPGELKRVFADARTTLEMPVVVVAGWINAFPELLIGGEYDALIEGLSADAEESGNRCACFAQKAWMHRVAGRMSLSRMYWDSLNTSWTRQPDFRSAFDEADWRAQKARNLARAGKADEARKELERAMDVEVSAFESVFILRRRAQTFTELGDAEKAVEDLETLLQVPSPVTPHTIRVRVTWEPNRGDPTFLALLQRYPVR